MPEKHSLPSGNKSTIFHLPQNYQGVKMTSFNHILSEMPLVLFTILVQAVIGLSLVYAPAFINGYKNYAI